MVTEEALSEWLERGWPEEDFTFEKMLEIWAKEGTEQVINHP